VEGSEHVLRRERTQALALLASLTADFDRLVAASVDANADDEHDPEGATIAFERSQLGALIARAQSRLHDIDNALARIADGAYGVCTRCDRTISVERLRARPTATTCIACASTVE
jgi:RNA polymerase-binding protein DksA